MSNKKVKERWVSQAVLAKELGLSSSMVISNWITRGKIKWKLDENIGMRLVDANSIIPDQRFKKKE